MLFTIGLTILIAGVDLTILIIATRATIALVKDRTFRYITTKIGLIAFVWAWALGIGLPLAQLVVNAWSRP